MQLEKPAKQPGNIAVQLTRKAFLLTPGEKRPILYQSGAKVWIAEDQYNDSMVRLDDYLNPIDPADVPENPILQVKREQEEEGVSKHDDLAEKLGSSVSKPPASMKADPAKDSQVKLAVTKFDKSDESLWTDEGLPRVEKVREKVGFSVSRADIDRVAPDVRRSNGQ